MSPLQVLHILLSVISVPSFTGAAPVLARGLIYLPWLTMKALYHVQAGAPILCPGFRRPPKSGAGAHSEPVTSLSRPHVEHPGCWNLLSSQACLLLRICSVLFPRLPRTGVQPVCVSLGLRGGRGWLFAGGTDRVWMCGLVPTEVCEGRS